MNKLSEMIKGVVNKWKELKASKKIALSILAAVALITFGTLMFIAFKPKYVVLFSNMNSQDSGAVIEGLKGKKAKYKVQGDSILVEKSQVDKLRMELLSEVPMTEGSKGFELFDSGKVAPTDSEAKIMYQRALSGEIERTIKSFPEVQWAKVNLVLPDNSAFVTKPAPATASVTLKLMEGKELSKEQAKAIVSLITGSVQNLPKENVTIVSDNFKLLTENLFEDKKDDFTSSTDKQLISKKEIEKEYEKKILNVLEPIYKDGIRVAVDAKVNFDAKQENNVVYSGQGAIVSEHEVIDETTGGGNTSGSPVDNNLSNNQNAQNSNTKVTHKETTKNYEPTKKEENIVKAPGQVERVSASVVVNGNIDAQTRTSITNLVSEAIGFDKNRGDAITVENLNFNSEAKDLAQKNLEEMKQAEAIAKRNKLIALSVGGAAALIMVVIVILSMRRRNKDNETVDEIEGIDMVIGETITPKPQETFESLNLEIETEKEHVVKEVKKYAEQKPEQVAEIIKSWLAEDERG